MMMLSHIALTTIFSLQGCPNINPKKGDVIIDMGAHIGTFSLLASSKSEPEKFMLLKPVKRPLTCYESMSH